MPSEPIIPDYTAANEALVRVLDDLVSACSLNGSARCLACGIVLEHFQPLFSAQAHEIARLRECREESFNMKLIELPNGDKVHADSIIAIRRPNDSPPRVVVDYGDKQNLLCIVLKCADNTERDALAERLAAECKDKCTKKTSVQQAMERLSAAINDGSGPGSYSDSWLANIAMPILDQRGKLDLTTHEGANAMAEILLRHFFGKPAAQQ